MHLTVEWAFLPLLQTHSDCPVPDQTGGRSKDAQKVGVPHAMEKKPLFLGLPPILPKALPLLVFRELSGNPIAIKNKNA